MKRKEEHAAVLNILTLLWQAQTLLEGIRGQPYKTLGGVRVAKKRLEDTLEEVQSLRWQIAARDQEKEALK